MIPLTRRAPLDPRGFGSLILWLDATKHKGTASGGNLGTVLDLSRKNDVVAGGTVPTWQVAGLNGRPSFRFGGAGSVKTAAALFTDDEFTLFTVLSGAAQINKAIVAQNSSGAGRTNFQNTDTATGVLARIFFNNGATREANSVDTVFESKPHAVMTRSDGLGFWTLQVDGGREADSISGQTVTPSAVQFTIGGTTDGATFFTGDIGEVLVYNRSLTADQIFRVQQYLTRKWGAKFR